MKTFKDGLVKAQEVITALITPDFMPWVELNKPSNENVDYVLKGIEAWAPHCDRVIVTTAPDYWTWTYAALVASPLPIIGGIKTFAVMDDFADAAGWRLIAAISAAIVQKTGTNIIVLDSEVSLKGQTGIHIPRLSQSIKELARLADDVEFWFYFPHIQPDALRESTIRLTTTMHAAVPTARFFLGKSGVPNGLDDPKQLLLREDMIRITNDQTCELLYITPDGYTKAGTRVFTVDELQEHLPQRPPGHIVVYPSFEHWQWAANAW